MGAAFEMPEYAKDEVEGKLTPEEAEAKRNTGLTPEQVANREAINADFTRRQSRPWETFDDSGVGDEASRGIYQDQMRQKYQGFYDDTKRVGEENYGVANKNAGIISGAATDAMASGSANAATASGMSETAARYAAGTPESYGDKSLLAGARTSAAAMGQYAPSAGAVSTTGQLAGYDAGTVDSRLGNSYDALRAYAQQGPGPSAAEAQLRRGQDANVAAQVALARSGRGAGTNANAMRQAAFQASDIGQRTNAESSVLRASEEAQWRQQKLAAESAAGGVAGTIESAAQGREAARVNALTSAAGFYNAQDAARLEAERSAAAAYTGMYGATSDAGVAAAGVKQNWYNTATANQVNAAAQDANAYTAGMSGYEAAANQYNTAGQNRMAATAAAQDTASSYDALVNANREAQAERETGTARLETSLYAQQYLAGKDQKSRKEAADRSFAMGVGSAGVGAAASMFGAVK